MQKETEKKALDKKAWGAHLKSVRLHRKLSQGELARRAGLSLSTLLSWEHGIKEPLFSGFVILADALDVSLNVLAGLAPLPKRDMRP